MKPRFLISIVVLLLACGNLLADTSTSEAPVKGAKELFFDPTDGAVVSATRPNSFKAPLPPPRKPGVGGSATAQKKKEPAGSQLAQKEPKPKPTNPSPGLRPIVVEAVNKTSTLGLSYWIELVGQDGKGQQVTDSRIFRSGEKIRIHFRSNADGNIALLQLGSSGTSSVLFPDPAKGLNDSRIAAGEDHILPTDSAWFRFDETPGTEKILTLFARSQQDLDTFSVKPTMDATATKAVMINVERIRGGKDLILETENEKVSEIGGYGVNLAGKPVVMEIQLKHQ